MPTLAALIPTFRRHELIPLVVRSLQLQTRPPDPSFLVGALCTNTLRDFQRYRATAVTSDRLYFAGEDGAFSVPICGPWRSPTCCTP